METTPNTGISKQALIIVHLEYSVTSYINMMDDTSSVVLLTFYD